MVKSRELTYLEDLIRMRRHAGAQDVSGASRFMHARGLRQQGYERARGVLDMFALLMVML